MEELRNILAAKATAVVPGPGYNAFRAEQEERARPLFFEFALPARGAAEALMDTIVPSFARFLERKKQNLESPSNVLVAVFLGDLCYVLQGGILFDLFCELEGITRQALRFRVRGWLQG